MRNAQITIQLELFGDQASNQGTEKITVYADSNNVFETIAAGMQELLKALQKNGRSLPSFGACEHRTVFRDPPEIPDAFRRWKE